MEDELDLWKSQCLVLSHLRDHGNLERAANQGGFGIGHVGAWDAEDVLGFHKRASAVWRSLGLKVESTIMEQILSGKNVSPTLTKMVLEANLPDKYGKNTAPPNEDSKKFMQKQRELSAERRLSEELEGLLKDLKDKGEVPEPFQDFKLAELLKLRSQRGT